MIRPGAAREFQFREYADLLRTVKRAGINKLLRGVIVEVARPLGIALHVHIIVGKDGRASLKGPKLIDWVGSQNEFVRECPLIG